MENCAYSRFKISVSFLFFSKKLVIEFQHVKKLLQIGHGNVVTSLTLTFWSVPVSLSSSLTDFFIFIYINIYIYVYLYFSPWKFFNIYFNFLKFLFIIIIIIIIQPFIWKIAKAIMIIYFWVVVFASFYFIYLGIII